MRHLSAWLLLSFLLILAGGLVAADMISCAKCGRYIREGQYLQIGSQYFHQEHFVCANCGKPIGTGQYFAKDGRFYDRKCYENVFSLRCAYCGEIITGEYTIKDGRNYHKTCFVANVAPKCAWCGDPVADSSISSEGKTYHSKCYNDHVALRCGLCGETIQGQYVTSFRNGAWHKWHKGSAPECDMCGAFIEIRRTESFTLYDDGRYLCSACAATAIVDVDQVEELADTLAPILAGLGMQLDVSKLVFRLAPQNEMKSLGHSPERAQRGFTDFRQYSRLFGLMTEQQLTVTILYGMPKMECVKVLAHELTHAWLFSNGRSKTAPALAEGSCNQVALFVLRQYPGPESDYLITNLLIDTDPVYGQGLRDVKAWVERVGVRPWVNYLLTKDEVPW